MPRASKGASSDAILTEWVDTGESEELRLSQHTDRDNGQIRKQKLRIEVVMIRRKKVDIRYTDSQLFRCPPPRDFARGYLIRIYNEKLAVALPSVCYKIARKLAMARPFI